MTARFVLNAGVPVALLLALLLSSCDAAQETAAGPDDDPDDETVQPEDDDPVMIGFLGALSGPFTVYGEPNLQGMRLAVEDVNAGGGVLGRPLELVERDSQGSPDETSTAYDGMVERDAVVAVGGVISSDAGLAASRAAEEHRVPVFLGKAGSHRIITQDSRYTFRTCLPAGPTIMGPVAAFVEEEGLARVGAISADYEWGHSVQEAIEQHISPLDGVEPQLELAPVGEDDFTPYLRRLEDLDPEMIVVAGHPPGAGAAIRQATDMGMDDVYTVGPYNPMGFMLDSAGPAVFDSYIDSTCADYEDPQYQELATRYYDAVGEFMELDAIAGYATVHMVAEAIEETGSTDPTEIADYVRANEFDPPGFAWTIAYTEYGELVDASPPLTVIREQEPPEGVHPGADWYPEILFRPPPLPTYEP